MKYYLISDLTHLPRCNVQSPRSAVGSAAHGGQPFAPPLLPPGQANSLSAHRFPLPAPGGEPFAPPRGESAATGKAPQDRQCAWLGSRTPQSQCLDLWHPAKPMR